MCGDSLVVSSSLLAVVSYADLFSELVLGLYHGVGDFLGIQGLGTGHVGTFPVLES